MLSGVVASNSLLQGRRCLQDELDRSRLRIGFWLDSWQLGQRFRRCLRIGGSFGSGAHEFLLSAPLLEPLEVTPNRGSHVVEVAFLPHHGCVPARLGNSSPVAAEIGARFAAAPLLLC